MHVVQPDMLQLLPAWLHIAVAASKATAAACHGGLSWPYAWVQLLMSVSCSLLPTVMAAPPKHVGHSAERMCMGYSCHSNAR